MQQYEAVSQLNSERYARLERAQVLVNQFWETYEELNPWIEETQALISQLPPPAIDHEQLKQQQEDMRVRGRSLLLLHRWYFFCKRKCSSGSKTTFFLIFFPVISLHFGGPVCIIQSTPGTYHVEITAAYVGAHLPRSQLAPKGAWWPPDLLPDCGSENRFVLLGQRAAK